MIRRYSFSGPKTELSEIPSEDGYETPKRRMSAHGTGTKVQKMRELPSSIRASTSEQKLLQSQLRKQIPVRKSGELKSKNYERTNSLLSWGNMHEMSVDVFSAGSEQPEQPHDWSRLSHEESDRKKSTPEKVHARLSKPKTPSTDERRSKTKPAIVESTRSPSPIVTIRRQANGTPYYMSPIQRTKVVITKMFT